ncbi:MAG: hypothetical protein AABX07_05030 [Nanoarchaeota archaeon]
MNNQRRRLIFYADVDTNGELDPTQRAYPYLQISRVSGDPFVVLRAIRVDDICSRDVFISAKEKGYELHFASDTDLFNMNLADIARCLESDEQQAIRKNWDSCAVPHPTNVPA